MLTLSRFGVVQTASWSKRNFIVPFLWALAATSAHQLLGLTWLSLPWLPVSAVAVAVAFYLGFKNNASYDRMWEARKIWGGIVNTSRAWAYGVRDLPGAHAPQGDFRAQVEILIHRHCAWLHALRFQLRRLETWEHSGPRLELVRTQLGVPEWNETLRDELLRCRPESEVDDVLERINPAAHLIAAQSADLAVLRRTGGLDGFSHTHLQGLLDELIAQQGKAERIKKFPFPRQYATVNTFFALIFCFLLPFGLLQEFDKLGGFMVWATVPFSALVSWVFLTTDQIGEWSENPFEGLHNDVPISSMARGIERDVREIFGERELPPTYPVKDGLMF